MARLSSWGPSINYVTLKSGKIDPLPPLSRQHHACLKKWTPTSGDVTFLGHFHITPPPPPPTQKKYIIENLNKESRNKVNFKRMFIMLRKQCTLLMQNSENAEEKILGVTSRIFMKPPTPHILPPLTVTKSVYPLPHPCVT